MFKKKEQHKQIYFNKNFKQEFKRFLYRLVIDQYSD